MQTKTKIWLLIAALLVLLGGVSFAVLMAANGWDFGALNTSNFKTNTYEIEEEFDSLSFNLDTTDVFILPSEDGRCHVICHERENESHTVSVKDGVLTITLVDNSKWYEYLLSFGSMKITVYLPKEEYETLTLRGDTGDYTVGAGLRFASVDHEASTGDLTVKADVTGLLKARLSTGDMKIENLSVGAMDLETSTGDITLSSLQTEGQVTLAVDTGDIRLTDVSLGSLSTSGDTGDIHCKNLLAADALSITRDTGDVKLEGCRAGSIRIETSTGDVRFDGSDADTLSVTTSTGDVKGTLLSEKIFYARTSSGTVRVPTSTEGGLCEVETSSGDIILSVQ